MTIRTITPGKGTARRLSPQQPVVSHSPLDAPAGTCPPGHTGSANRAATTRTLGVGDDMSDVFLVTITAASGRRNARIVLAADQRDACAAHREHYPNDEIVKIEQCCRHCGKVP